MNSLLNPSLRPLEPVLLALFDAAEKAAENAVRAAKRSGRRRPPGAPLKPGADTPLWNVLAESCRQRLTRHGDKAKLGRLLGLPRQRIHQLLVAKSACADAERTLLLLAWLAQKNRGEDPA